MACYFILAGLEVTCYFKIDLVKGGWLFHINWVRSGLLFHIGWVRGGLLFHIGLVEAEDTQFIRVGRISDVQAVYMYCCIWSTCMKVKHSKMIRFFHRHSSLD